MFATIFNTAVLLNAILGTPECHGRWTKRVNFPNPAAPMLSGPDSERLQNRNVRSSEVSQGTEPTYQYVVVFDAGSTGTRVHVYSFDASTGEKPELLVDEVYRKVKPGLSDYVKTPDQGVQSIQSLLDTSLATVPEAQRANTPVIFKATAGLRMADKAGAENLLNKIQEKLNQTGFDVSLDRASIMSGQDEAYFGWLTINYLLGNQHKPPSQTAVTVDLGGGSMQVTLADPSAQLDDVYENLKLQNAFSQSYYLYAKSYLGLGLKAARFGSLDKGDNRDYSSACLPVNYTGSHTYNGKVYNVRGPTELKPDQCWNQSLSYLTSDVTRVTPLLEVKDPLLDSVCLFSYFFDVLKWAGFICEDQTIMYASVYVFKEIRREVCSNPDVNEPFLCQDLTFIARVLGDQGFQFPPLKPLVMVSQIALTETSWTLGAALDALVRMTGDF